MLKREKYLRDIRPFYNHELIKVLMGIRRSGKTVIMDQIKDELIESGVSKENILYINMESSVNYEIKDHKSFAKYVIDYFKGKKGKVYLFVDEVQLVDQFEIAINSLRVDIDSSIFITGSNADLLSGELATLLAGRYVSFKVYPFDYNEFITFKGLDAKNPAVFDEYLRYGGFPLVLENENKSSKMAVLDDIYNSIILKDIIGHSKTIRDAQMLTDLINYIINESGSTFSVKSITNYFNHLGAKTTEITIRSYLEQIINSMMVNVCNRYDLKGKKVLSKEEKYYIADHGLKNLLNNFAIQDQGRLYENVVYNHCRSHGYNVYIGKIGEYEVDFKIVKHDVIKYIQVAYMMPTQDVVDREFRSLLQINDNHEKIIVSLDPIDLSRDGIKHINLYDFLSKEI